MSGAEQYHKGLQQPFRIQKRLTLNQCFRLICSENHEASRLTYITFGGRDLYDVMDLLAVFDMRLHSLHVVSYEQDPATAAFAQECRVASTLLKIKSIRIQIVPNQFPADIERLVIPDRFERAIFYLDYTGTFNAYHRESLDQLLEFGLIRAGDFLLITSCLSPRVVHQDRFMRDYETDYAVLYGMTSEPNKEFKARNHVDLLVGITVSKYERTLAVEGIANKLWAHLVRKYKYKDSRTPMGLWLYRFEEIASRFPPLSDHHFEEFPHSVSATPAEVLEDLTSEPEIPDLFDFD